jgi:hypothetical protein
LGNTFAQQKILASGKYKPGGSSALIDHSLEIGKQVWVALSFIKNYPVIVGSQEAFGVFLNCQPYTWVFQRHIAIIRVCLF